MKLRLPAALAAALIACYPVVFAESTDLNGTDSEAEIILLDEEYLTNSASKNANHTGTLNVTGNVSIGGTGGISLKGTLSGSGNITKSGSGSLLISLKPESTFQGNLNVAGSELQFETDFGAGNTVTVGEGAMLTFFCTDLAMNSDIVFEGNNQLYHRKEGGKSSAVVKGTTTFNGNTYYIGQYAKNLIFEGAVKGTGVFEVRNAIYGDWDSVELRAANTFSGTFRVKTMDPPETYNPKHAKIIAKHDQAMEFASVELIGTSQFGDARIDVETTNLLIKTLYGNEYSVLYASAAGKKITLKEGGTFFGTLTNGLNLETAGLLVLGRSGDGQNINSVISGAGGIQVKEGLRVNLSTENTYTGNTTVKPGAILALGTGAALSDKSLLIMDSGTLLLNSGKGQTLNGLQLADGSESSISLGTGSSLTAGAITGLGSLLISGADSITGTITADKLFKITFLQGNELYNAKISGGNIIKGDLFSDLQANSNDGNKSFTFRNVADLTMGNGAGTLYTLGNLAVSGTGKTLTLGAGGLKLNGSLSYSNAEAETMTIGGGPLQADGILKKGAGEIRFNSQVTMGSLLVEGTAVFSNGGTVTNRLSGNGTLRVEGAGKVFSVNAGVNSTDFTGTLSIAAGSVASLNGTGTTTLGGLTGAGTLNVTAGTVNIKGALTTAPEGSEAEYNRFIGVGLSLGKDAVVSVDHTGITANGSTDKPYAPRTIMNLTGSGKLVLNTIGGDTSGGTASGYMGSFIYTGDGGFTGTIQVKKGFLGFRVGEWDNAKVILDGGGLSDGCHWQGASLTNTRKNDIEIGAGGAVIRLFSNNTLILTGRITGSGEIKRVDAGSLEFSGDMSGFTGNISISGGSTTTKFTGTTSMGVLTFDNEATILMTGKTTSLGGITHKAVKTALTLETDELTIGAGGIKSTTDSWTLAARVGTFKASADWTLASNVTLQQTAGTGFVMDTRGHDVTFDGNLGFGLGVGDSGKKIVKNGAGTWTLKQDGLSLPGSVTVNGGTLRYEGSGFSSAVTLSNGGILNFSQNQSLTKSVTGTGIIKLDKDVQLNVQGNVFNGRGGLTLSGGNIVNFTGNAPGTQNLGDLTVSSTGNELVFLSDSDMVLNMSDALLAAGSGLIVGNYEYSHTNYLKMSGLTAWEKLEGVSIRDKDGQMLEAMVDTRGHVIAYTKDVVVGSLVSSGVKSDGSGYTYDHSARYYGALDGKTVDFSLPFEFASGTFCYGFTTRDDLETGMSAGSFTVSGKLTDGDKAARSVSILGQEGASGRTITFTNTENSFTDNVTVTQAVLKVKSADPSLSGVTPVRILGVNNSIYLNDQATLDLATGEGSYIYSNNFILNGDGAALKQTSGEHVLTGNITLSGAGNGNRTIENALSDKTLTLTGNLSSRGGNTLVLQTQGSEDSRIILATGSDSSLNRLVVNGHVEQTKNTLSVASGMTLGDQSSYLLSSGTLAVGESLSSSGGISRTVSFGNGTTLRALGDRLAISSGVVLAFAHEQSAFALDTGSGTVDFRGTLGDATTGNTFTKKGDGALEWGNSTTTKVNLKIEQGTLTLKENVNFSTTGDISVQKGSVLNLETGSSLGISPNSNFVFNGSLTGKGSLSGTDKLVFGGDARYAADMSGQSWNAVFQGGSSFSGSLLKHSGNIVFEEGSRIHFDTTLPESDKSIGISTTSGSTVRFNGTEISGSTSTPDVDWDATKSYEFTLVRAQNELLGKDGKSLSMNNLDQSVAIGGDGWGAFLTGELILSEDSKELMVNITRNENAISSYAQTGNQIAAAQALDYAMDNYSSLGLRGTELGDIIQFFNKMGQNIAAEAPEALGMVGGLSNYQALAGQRTDMMRHLEAVRQRANAGKGLVGISNIPDNSFWAEGTQSYSRVDGVDNSTPGYTAQTWGAAIGVDYLSGTNYSLGVAFAYSNLTVDSNQYAGQTKADNYYVDLYGRWESGNWNGVFVLSGGTADVDVKRTMSLGENAMQGKGSADGTQIIGMAEVAYDWQWEAEGPVLQPYLGMAVGGSKLDGYTESGLGNAGLVMDEQKQTVAQASLGVRLYKQNIDREMQYETSRWELRCGLVEEFGDTDFVTRSSFIGLPGYTMSTTSDDIGRTGLQIGGGFSCAIDQAWSVFGDVNGEFRNGQTSMNSTLGLRCTF